MRTKKTNFLQAALLVSGIVYFILGLMVIINPTSLPAMTGIQVPDDWITQIKLDSVILPLYVILRSLGFLLLFTALSFILPIFDPLKYRGLVYYLGFLFPFSAGLFLLFNSIFIVNSKPVLAVPAAFVLSLVFLVCGLVLFIALLLTKKAARKGAE